MGKVTGFLEFPRLELVAEPPRARTAHWREFLLPLTDDQARVQGARCMDCGIPFCVSGCPVNNVIPDFNDLVYRHDWASALEILHSTNNFPEFTGRVCPAPCEAACTLNINQDPVGIKSIEHALVEKGWAEGWIQPRPALERTGRRVAVVGSGPAGLACAQQLARAGHDVTVFEKGPRVGGLLRYGIPDFKLEKSHVDRRVAQLEAEGVVFRTHARVAADAEFSPRLLLEQFDAVVLAGGAERPRALEVPGRDLAGIHFAMDFLTAQNQHVGGEHVSEPILATGKDVVVIGGGDTGSDCVGTANRQGARSVTQFELLPQPPGDEDKGLTWPYWPIKLRTSSSHEEGCARDWAVTTQRFEGQGRVAALVGARVEWREDPRRMEVIPGSEFKLRADLVLLAMGFTGPTSELPSSFGVDQDARGNVRAGTEGPESYRTSVDKVFTAGDMRRGQSLVVWAIREGRQCARAVDEFLMGRTHLPR